MFFCEKIFAFPGSRGLGELRELGERGKTEEADAPWYVRTK